MLADERLADLESRADALVRAHRERKAAAAARIAAHLPRLKDRSARSILDRPLGLGEARRVVAREHRFRGWPQVVRRIALARRLEQHPRHPGFDDALAVLKT